MEREGDQAEEGVGGEEVGGQEEEKDEEEDLQGDGLPEEVEEGFGEAEVAVEDQESDAGGEGAHHLDAAAFPAGRLGALAGGAGGDHGEDGGLGYEGGGDAVGEQGEVELEIFDDGMGGVGDSIEDLAAKSEAVTKDSAGEA